MVLGLPEGSTVCGYEVSNLKCVIKNKDVEKMKDRSELLSRFDMQHLMGGWIQCTHASTARGTVRSDFDYSNVVVDSCGTNAWDL